MTMYPSSSTQQPAAICALKSPADAIHILEAVRLGLVPRVTRRLTGHERSMIRPGTVWVWEEEETNMRRWTDGRRWGASRVGGGGFLVYTESSDSLSPPPSRPDSPSYNGYYRNGNDGQSGTPPRRPEPLVKQTYSTSMTHPVTGKVKKFHVVAYSSKRNPQGDGANPLPLPHQLPNLATIKIIPGIWPDWETRRDEFTSGGAARRAPSTPHSAPPAHGHHHSLAGPPPHPPPASGPVTPVTATAAPSYLPDAESPHMYPPGERPPYDRRYPPYPDYDPHRPPYSYDMYPYDRYPPPHDRYPYYPPPGREGPYGPPPHDYRYDPYYDRERGERDVKPNGDDVRPEGPRSADPRGRSPPRHWPPPHRYYRDPYMRDDMYGRPPPPHDYDYRRPPPRETGYPTPPDRDGEYPPRPHVEGEYPPPPREGDFPYPPHRESDYPHAPRELNYPYPPRDGETPRDGPSGGPPEGGAARPPSGSNLGKRPTESRPADEGAPASKRMPSWSPHPKTSPTHARQPSGGSAHGSTSSLREEPRPAGSPTSPRGVAVKESPRDDPLRGENWTRVPA